MALQAENMLNFLNETAMQGYEKLVSTSENYRDDVAKMRSMIEDNAKSVTNVTEMTVNFNGNFADIGSEAAVNETIAKELEAEVGKFKLA